MQKMNAAANTTATVCLVGNHINISIYNRAHFLLAVYRPCCLHFLVCTLSKVFAIHSISLPVLDRSLCTFVSTTLSQKFLFAKPKKQTTKKRDLIANRKFHKLKIRRKSTVLRRQLCSDANKKSSVKRRPTWTTLKSKLICAVWAWTETTEQTEYALCSQSHTHNGTIQSSFVTHISRHVHKIINK